MSEPGLGQRYRNYRPSKSSVFWVGVACIVATMIIGFTWGGWVTAATARDRADVAARDARTDLEATLCVARFMDGSDARARLATLKQTNSWQRDEVVTRGGWATLPGAAMPATGVADLCAQRLASMQLPPA
jgi:hypothetical protein